MAFFIQHARVWKWIGGLALVQDGFGALAGCGFLFAGRLTEICSGGDEFIRAEKRFVDDFSGIHVHFGHAMRPDVGDEKCFCVVSDGDSAWDAANLFVPDGNENRLTEITISEGKAMHHFIASATAKDFAAILTEGEAVE